MRSKDAQRTLWGGTRSEAGYLLAASGSRRRWLTWARCPRPPQGGACPKPDDLVAGGTSKVSLIVFAGPLASLRGIRRTVAP
jgi:hypothetical protein